MPWFSGPSELVRGLSCQGMLWWAGFTTPSPPRSSLILRLLNIVVVSFALIDSSSFQGASEKLCALILIRDDNYVIPLAMPRYAKLYKMFLNFELTALV